MNSPSGAALGIVLSTATGETTAQLLELGVHAEARGFDAVLVNEARADALAIAQAIATATTRVIVGTNIANIYFRHPFLCASSARAIAELSGGRLMLGLGMSHRELLKSLGIDMGDARATLHDYVSRVRAALNGEGGSSTFKAMASSFPVPVLVAGNTTESAIVAGETGDGLMPFLSPRSYLPSLVQAARQAAGPRRLPEFRCVMSIPTFISEDAEAARSAARYNLAFFAQLPNYRRQWRRAGFGAEMDTIRTLWAAGDRRAVAAAIPDALVDEVCVSGNAAACRDQLEAFRAAGADLPVLAVSPVNTDRLSATHAAIDMLGTT